MAEQDYNEDSDLLDGPPASYKPSLFVRFRLLFVLVIAVAIGVGGFYFFKGNDKLGKPSSGIKKMSFLQKNDDKEAKPEQKKEKKGKIKYLKLYDLTADETAKTLKELTLNNISFNTQQNGKNYSIFVDEKEMDTAKNLLALKGLPGGGSKGYELLDNSQTLGVTEFDKRIRFMRALSGELEKAILQFNAVESCKVQIVLPEQRLFAVTQPPVTASILIRKRPGESITDDTVFSIIQLVANAVEGLQPENISVIDTQGFVLSNGILERIAAKEAGLTKPSSPSKDTALSETSLGTPILPDGDQLDKWQSVKESFEKSLEKKATIQLTGILPPESFRIAINADLGPLENGEIVDIKRLTTSIVVNNAREDIFLDTNLKKQIFSTIASAIGYVKGRDTIQLSKADFTMINAAEREKLKNKQALNRLLRYAWRYAPYALSFMAGIGILWYGMRQIKKLVQARKMRRSSNLDEDAQVSPNRDSDFLGLQEEMILEKQLDQINSLAQRNNTALLQLLERWLVS